ncbi:hypothetical protein DVH05_009356 [Phytophthora capsici]|nr:hypothetical protein DVH05_009356 [Phytophthora capsici]
MPERVEKEELWEGFGIDTDYEDEPEEIESAVKEEDDSANEEESACEKEEIAEDKDVESAGEGGAGGSGESSGDIERDGESASGAANESNGGTKDFDTPTEISPNSQQFSPRTYDVSCARMVRRTRGRV